MCVQSDPSFIWSLIYYNAFKRRCVEILYFHAINVSMKEKSDGYIWR